MNVLPLILAADINVPLAPILQTLLDHLPMLLGTVILPFIVQWLRAHTKNAALDNAITVVESTAHGALAAVEAQLAPQLRAALADGVITDAERKDLTTTALNILKERLPGATTVFLEKVFGSSLEGWLLGWVERTLASKRAEEAAAAGVNGRQLDSIEAAVNEFNERLKHINTAQGGTK